MYKTFIAIIYLSNRADKIFRIAAKDNDEAEIILERSASKYRNLVGTYLKYSG